MKWDWTVFLIGSTAGSLLSLAVLASWMNSINICLNMLIESSLEESQRLIKAFRKDLATDRAVQEMREALDEGRRAAEQVVKEYDDLGPIGPVMPGVDKWTRLFLTRARRALGQEFG